MKNTLLIAAVLWVYCLPAAAKQPEQITPVPFNEVTLTEGFWKRRMQTELDVTLPFSLVQAGPAIEQLQLGAAFLEGKAGELPSPNGVLSSDLYKVMEGAAYSLMLRPDPELEAKMDSLTDIIGRAQQKDGYLFVCHTCGNIDPFWVGDKPYSKVVYSHELYGAGHLYEAAAAYYQATGKRALLDIAIKNARHVNRVFFEGDPAYNDGKPVMQAPGHEEIELALCKLYRVTGDRLYLDMAKKFLDIRGVTYRPDGEGFMSPFYAQQHAPVAEQTAPAGHAVRAVYLYTAMAQVDALTGKQHYTRALDAIWNNLVATRIYVTGGLGALASIEGFGAEYELPNLTAYSETCAAVGNVFFNQGMFLNSGEARYFDVAEISLFNNALAGINLAGDRFFYVNPLETDGEHRFNHGLGGRAPWFGCACCPPNISRMILQVPGYMYAYGRDRLYLTLYGSSRTSVSMNGVRVGVEQTSDYPFDGKVRIALTPEKRTAFRLCMRIPTWSEGKEFMPGGLYTYRNTEKYPVTIRVNGKPADYETDRGFAVVKRTWKTGDVVEMELPMPVRRVSCDTRVKENAGTTAVTRGPLVYCAEEADNGVVQRLSLTPGKACTQLITEGPLEKITRIGIPGVRADADGQTLPAEITLIPYYAWCNRGDNQTMRVWIPNGQAAQSDTGTPQSGIGSRISEVTASSVSEGTSPETVCGGLVADSSGHAGASK